MFIYFPLFVLFVVWLSIINTTNNNNNNNNLIYKQFMPRTKKENEIRENAEC